MWKKGNREANPDFVVTASVGVNNIFFDNKRANRNMYGLTRLEVEYGDIMNVANHKKPFDYFSVISELSFTSTSNLSNTVMRGVLWDKRIQLFDNTKDVLGIYKELELFINDIYKFTATQITTSIVTEYNWSGNRSIRLSSDFSVISLGGINSKYASIEGKDYNLGPGIAIGFKAYYRASETFSFSIHCKKFWIHILSGATGEEFVESSKLCTRVRITKHSTFGVDFVLSHRSAYYDKYSATSEYGTGIEAYFTIAI